MADNLPPSTADVTESGSLNLPEPSGTHKPVMGLHYMFLYIIAYIIFRTLGSPKIKTCNSTEELGGWL
jgi:hypothetical protein